MAACGGGEGIVENRRSGNTHSSRSNSTAQASRRKRKRRSKPDKARLHEIKHILLGNYYTLDDGTLMSGDGAWISPLGVGDGGGTILLLGVMDNCFAYGTGQKNPKQVMFAAFKAMKNIGRGVSLESAPDAVSCYVKSTLSRPVLLVFEGIGSDKSSKHFELHAYCGRSLSAYISMRRAVSSFDREMPDHIKMNT